MFEQIGTALLDANEDLSSQIFGNTFDPDGGVPEVSVYFDTAHAVAETVSLTEADLQFLTDFDGTLDRIDVADGTTVDSVTAVGANTEVELSSGDTLVFVNVAADQTTVESWLV